MSRFKVVGELAAHNEVDGMVAWFIPLRESFLHGIFICYVNSSLLCIQDEGYRLFW